MRRNAYPGLVALAFALAFSLAVAGCGSGSGSASRTATARARRRGGCGARPPVAPGATAPQALVSAGRFRTYLLHVPAPYDSRHHHPLVIVAHGHGRSAQESRVLGLDGLANRDGVVVAYPQGLRGPDGRTGWDTFGPTADRGVDDVAFVADLVDRLSATTCLDRRRVAIAGLSNGGGLANLVACRLADRVDAAAAVAGAFYVIPGGCHPSRPVPFLDVHGTADSTVPYAGSRAHGLLPVDDVVTGWAGHDGCRGRATTITDDRGVRTVEWRRCRGGAVVEGVLVRGAGHGWPGRTTGGAFDSVSAVWDFLHRPRS